MLTLDTTQEKTGLGNYFVANYPPFSFWKTEHLPHAQAALDRPPVPGTPLGLYLHIPFCRKRCHFCYFRVYTDKNAKDVATYTDALLREVELLAKTPCVGGRMLDFAGQGVEVSFDVAGVLVGVDAEVAELAALPAERDVQVQPKRRRWVWRGGERRLRITLYRLVRPDRKRRIRRDEITPDFGLREPSRRTVSHKVHQL